MKHEGINTHRFKDNPEERRFAKAWNVFAQDNLKHLLDLDQTYPPEPSVDDIRNCASVVQWLGSPVGKWFLESLGYVKVDKCEKG